MEVRVQACDQLLLDYYKEYALSGTEDSRNKIKRAQVISLESSVLAKGTSNSDVNSPAA
jgi:hypothetical protein